MKGAFIRLSAFLERYPKEDVKRFLGTFRCSKDADLEEFLHNKAIMFEDRGRSRTYLLLIYEGNNEILAYFTLALTEITVPAENSLKNSTIKKMDLSDGKTVGYLIGQLAKDDSVKEHIGHDLLDTAVEQLMVSYKQNGGRVMCIDCKEPMIGYYEDTGFKIIEPRPNEKNGLYRLIRLF